MGKIWAIGHSIRTWPEFVSALKSYGIRTVADVRAVPRSRRHHFDRIRLEDALAPEGIAYEYFGKELGGLRESGRWHSRHTAIRSQALRNYADHMETAEFRSGIEKLLRVAKSDRTAILCAERDWHHCHRALLSDYLTARGHDVVHILGAAHDEPHQLNPYAHLHAGIVVYESRQLTHQ